MRAAIRVDDRTSEEDHQTTEMPSANGDEHPSYAFMDIRIVLPVALSLLFLVLILALIHFYARCILHRRRLRLAAGLLPIRSTPAPVKAGLKGSAIAAMPTFPYAEEGQEAECLVCLNVVEKGEVMRLLPGCKHVFHADCIDVWLSLHSTCPLCRADAETPATEVMEVAGMAVESSSGAGPSHVGGNREVSKGGVLSSMIGGVLS